MLSEAAIESYKINTLIFIFSSAPIYNRSVMTGSYKNKVKICFILPQRFWKKGHISGLIKEKNFVIVINLALLGFFGI